MPIQQLTQVDIVTVPNGNTLIAPYDFRSVTEYKDLPMKRDCMDDGLLSSQDPLFWCQDGCNEDAFRFIVEPGDIVPLQFQFVDLLNPDPNNPALGWRTASGDYWLGLEVVSFDGTVLWSGDTGDIAIAYHVGVTDAGPYQNIHISIDRLLALLETGGHGDVTCWYFRVRVNTLIPAYDVVDDDQEPTEGVEVGYAYIDFANDQVLEWDGTEWVVIGPGVDRGYYYVAATGYWYEWNGTNWVGLVEGPVNEPEDVEFEYVVTMAYRLRRCDERIVRFTSSDAGRDCLGLFHDIGDPILLGPLPYKITPFYYDFKVKGSLEMDELPMQRTVTKNNRVVSTTPETRARMRCAGMPESVARMVQAVFSAPSFTVNEQPWDDFDSVRKNNDEGSHWWIDTVLSRKECEREVQC